MTINEPRLSAGWYPDPDASSGERWWNGSQWTSHTRTGPVVVDPAAADVTGLPGQPPKAWSASDYPLATIPAPDAGGTAMFVPADPVPGPATPAPPGVAPGWYPDPAGAPLQRWWDGAGWSAHTAPGAPTFGQFSAPGYSQVQVPYGSTTVVVVSPGKSVGVALLLTFFFGPLGMFYSTVSGALIMLGVLIVGGFVAGVLTLGLAWLFWWPMVWLASMVWGCVAASNQPASPVINNYR